MTTGSCISKSRGIAWVAIMASLLLAGCGNSGPDSRRYACSDGFELKLTVDDSGNQARLEIISLGSFDLVKTGDAVFGDGDLTLTLAKGAARLTGLPGIADLECKESSATE